MYLVKDQIITYDELRTAVDRFNKELTFVIKEASQSF